MTDSTRDLPVNAQDYYERGKADERQRLAAKLREEGKAAMEDSPLLAGGLGWAADRIESIWPLAGSTGPATQPEAPAEPQQPATAAHSDAQRQRQQLRRRLTRALHDADCSHRTCSCVMGHYAKLADAVLPILDEELQRVNRDYLHAANRAEVERQRAEAAEQERDNLREHVAADHQVLAEVRKLADAAADMHVVGNKYERGRHDLAAAILEVITGSADE